LFFRNKKCLQASHVYTYMITKTTFRALLLAMALSSGMHSTQAEQPADQDQPAGLSQAQAVATALQHSPALQALVAESAAQQARAQASARPSLLRFSFARLRQGDEREIDRSLSVGLFELLTWPWRAQAADSQVNVLQRQQAMNTLNHAQAVRVQWVQAVASQQKAVYMADVMSAAQTASTLASRLEASGQFSAAQAAQERVAEAEAQQAMLRARQQAVADREALVRLIGLQGDEARQLTLPDRLPDVPATLAWQADQVATAAQRERLDTRMAQARWQAMQSSSTDETLRSLVDVEAGWQRQSTSGQAVKQGPELTFSVLATDLGAARRRSANADEQAALAQWQQTALVAESQIRESWARYQSAHEAAVHAREVLGPIRQRLLSEKLKQYNGMLIGPLELLAEARSHAVSVITAMEAQRDYHLAELALRSAMDGSTAPASMSSADVASPTAGSSHAAH
jgi:outer membrane protein TolC